MSLFLISNGSYSDSIASVLNESVEDRLPLVVIEAEDAFDERIREAVHLFAEETGTDLSEVTINKLSAPLSLG
ncbi:MAG: hypothetical protein ACXAB9_15575 [Candidatus Thorarchaeota archaeon]|jgi:hypothetical protein